MLPPEHRHLGGLGMDPVNAYDGDLAAYGKFKEEQKERWIEGSKRRRAAFGAATA